MFSLVEVLQRRIQKQRAYILCRFTALFVLQQKLAAMCDLICITDALASLLAGRLKLLAMSLQRTSFYLKRTFILTN